MNDKHENDLLRILYMTGAMLNFTAAGTLLDKPGKALLFFFLFFLGLLCLVLNGHRWYRVGVDDGAVARITGSPSEGADPAGKG